MNKNQSNKKVLTLLTIAVLVIWGAIGYRSVIYFFSSDNSENEIQLEHDLVKSDLDNINFELSETSIEYRKLDRDPFLYTMLKKKPDKKSLVKQRVTKTKVDTIDYRINGVIINDKSKMVILEDVTNSNTLFLREGEKYKYIIIKKVLSNSVMVLENKKKREVLIHSQ